MAETTSNLNLVVNFLGLLTQLRVYHWQTKSYAEHQAFGMAYDTLSGLIDSFIEVYMGKHGRIVAASGKFDFSAKNYNNADIGKVCDDCIAYLMNLSEPLKDCTDLLNIRDEMLGTLNKLKYLLTLK